MKNRMSDEATIKLAWQAIEYTHEKLPLGSVNKQSDEQNPDMIDVQSQLSKLRNNKKSLMQKLSCLASVHPTSIKDQRLLKWTLKSQVYEKYKVGNCEEQATVALIFLKKNGLDDVDCCAMKGGDHQFLLLNGNIICDPWANNVYHVSEFTKEREAAKEFHYSYLVYEERPDIRPFLFGLPYVKFHTGSQKTQAIVNGQFVRSGVDNLLIDYSEYFEALESERKPMTPSLRA